MCQGKHFNIFDTSTMLCLYRDVTANCDIVQPSPQLRERDW